MAADRKDISDPAANSLPLGTSRSLPAHQFIDQRRSVVNLSQRLQNAGRVNADRPRTFVLFDLTVAIRELLIIAVEIQTDDLARSVDHRRTAVTSDRIG